MLPRLSSFIRSFFSRVLIVTMLVASNCVEPYLPKVVQTNYNYLVVEGFLIDGTVPTVIRLSRTQMLDNKDSNITPEVNAVVQIEEEEGGLSSLVNNKDGSYSAIFSNLSASKNYRLRISTNDGKEYASDFVRVKHSPAIDSVTWQQDADEVHFFVNAHDPENKTVYYFWTYDETWQYSSWSYSIYKYENGQVKTRDLADELYYCWKTAPSPNVFLSNTKSLSQDIVSHQKLHRLSQRSRKLEYGYSLLVKQYALDKEAYAYWENIKKNSENIGTLFDRTPPQDIGNIHCLTNPEESTLGYFVASSLSTKRIFIARQQVSGPHLPDYKYEKSDYEECGAKLLPPSQINDKGLKGLLLIDRSYDLVTQEFLGYVVAPATCVDCRFNGGINVKPDFWK